MTNINKKISTILIIFGLVLPPFQLAAESIPSTPSPTDATLPTGDPARELCASYYRFGSVIFSFKNKDQIQTINPGEKFRVAGAIKNENAYPMPGGQILVRILRQDEKTAQRDWHPIVADLTLKDMELKANASRDFDFTWPVPVFSPAGIYRAEFFYQAAERFSMAGLPFISNATAGSVLFTIKDAGIKTTLTFDRSSVLLNGKPLSLRSVPPTLSNKEPVTVLANLKLENTNDKEISFKLTKKLYNWSDADPGKPVAESTETLSLRPNQTVPVRFGWDKPQEGVYQLQLSAVPENSQILPSLLKVRFPIGGDSPRLVYAGIGKIKDDGSAEVITCALNGTFGETKGKVATEVTVDGKVVAQETGDISKGGVAATVISLSKKQIKNGFTVNAKTTNKQGDVTDNHSIVYSQNILGLGAANTTGQNNQIPVDIVNNNFFAVMLVILAAILALSAGLFVALRYVNKKKIKSNNIL